MFPKPFSGTLSSQITVYKAFFSQEKLIHSEVFSIERLFSSAGKEAF